MLLSSNHPCLLYPECVGLCPAIALGFFLLYNHHMPYTIFESDGLVVESEVTRTTLRIFDGKRRVFSCEVTTTGPDSARITNGNGQMSKAINSAIRHWLRDNGYNSYSYERAGKGEKHFNLAQS